MLYSEALKMVTNQTKITKRNKLRKGNKVRVAILITKDKIFNEQGDEIGVRSDAQYKIIYKDGEILESHSRDTNNGWRIYKVRFNDKKEQWIERVFIFEKLH